MGQIQFTSAFQDDQVHVLNPADESVQCHRPVFHERRFAPGNNARDSRAGPGHTPGILSLPVDLEIMGIMLDHRRADPSR